MHTNIANYLSESFWYTTPEHFDNIKRVSESVLDGTNAGLREQFIEANEGDIDYHATPEPTVYGSTAVIPIHGTIMKRANLFMQFSGGASADVLARQFRRLGERGDVDTVILDVDSPGGSVHGIEVAARELRKLRETKTVYAVANDMMCSAAYYIASAADKVYVTPSSIVGSIGVIAMLVDKSEALEKEGYKVHVMRSAEYKALLNGSEPFTEKGLKEYEKGIKYHHNAFVNAISKNLNITMEEAQELADGRTYEGDEAVAAGLADGELTLEELIEQIEMQAEEEGVEATSIFKAHMESATNTVSALRDEKEALEAKIDTLEGEMEEIRQANLRSRAEGMVAEAIEEGKIAPVKEERYVEMAMEHGVGHVKLILEDIPKGAVVPVEEGVEEEKPEASEDGIAFETEAERDIAARFPSLKEYL